MSNEIKKGDKVRVSKDAPKMYFRGWDTIFKSNDCNVLDVEDDNAAIAYGPYIKAVPTKYLVKVDAATFRLADVVSDAGLHQDNYLNEDKKEPKIKLGDMVRVKGNLHEPFCLDADLHLEITNIPPHVVSQKEWKVIKVENRRDCAGHIYTLNNGDSFIHNIPEDCVELVQPAEQTEAEKEPNHTIKIPVEVDLTDSYWDAYTANLAKELAIVYAKHGWDPLDAVGIAKGIVKILKQK